MKFLKTHGALLLVNLIYGANFSITKAIMPKYIAPYGFILIRVSSAALLYFIINHFFIKEKINKTDFKRLFLCGIFGVAANQLLFFKGLSLTSSENGSILMIVTPILVMLFSFFVLKEKFTLPKIGGLILGAIGVLFLLSGKKFTFNSSTLVGDICIFLNAASYAIYLVIVKPLMKKYHPLTVIGACFNFGLVWVLLFGIQDFLAIPWQEIPTINYLNILYVVLGATFLVYLLNVAAMKHVSPSVVGIYVYVQPIFAILIELFYFQKPIAPEKYIAFVLIALGVYLVSKKNSAPEIIAE